MQPAGQALHWEGLGAAVVGPTLASPGSVRQRASSRQPAVSELSGPSATDAAPLHSPRVSRRPAVRVLLPQLSAVRPSRSAPHPMEARASWLEWGKPKGGAPPQRAWGGVASSRNRSVLCFDPAAVLTHFSHSLPAAPLSHGCRKPDAARTPFLRCMPPTRASGLAQCEMRVHTCPNGAGMHGDK